jgi:hypothetical protein
MNELASMGHHCKHTKNGLCKCKCNTLFKGTYNPRYSRCSTRVRLFVFVIVVLVFDWQDAGSVRPLDRSTGGRCSNQSSHVVPDEGPNVF